MIIVDTNVVSDRMRLEPSIRVRHWLEAVDDSELYTTAISQSEILYGIAILPEGKRRSDFEAAAHRVFSEDFAERVLPFDERAAGYYASITSDRRRRGKPIAIFDAMIASIALSNDATLATRNVRDFVGTGIRVIDPWS